MLQVENVSSLFNASTKIKQLNHMISYAQRRLRQPSLTLNKESCRRLKDIFSCTKP